MSAGPVYRVDIAVGHIRCSGNGYSVVEACGNALAAARSPHVQQTPEVQDLAREFGRLVAAAGTLEDLQALIHQLRGLPPPEAS